MKLLSFRNWEDIFLDRFATLRSHVILRSHIALQKRWIFQIILIGIGIGIDIGSNNRAQQERYLNNMDTPSAERIIQVKETENQHIALTKRSVRPGSSDHGSRASSGGGGGGGGSSSSSRSNSESRDDGDQRWRQPQRHPKPVTDMSHGISGYPSIAAATTTSRRRHSTASLRHHKNNLSLDNVHLELLRSEQQKLTERLQELEVHYDSIQKKKAYERSLFAMKRGQLLVEIEGLREDKVFLTKKRDKLGQKLLEMHMKRLELLETEKKGSDEVETQQILKCPSYGSI